MIQNKTSNNWCTHSELQKRKVIKRFQKMFKYSAGVLKSTRKKEKQL